jgi:3-hydroxyisobutyryl-CoA hydrolase
VEVYEFVCEEYILNYLIGTYKLQYIALIDEITMGGVCFFFFIINVLQGIFPDVGGSYFLP